MPRLTPLPIDDLLPSVREALLGSVGAVIQAAPGAGKTTRVPLSLLEEPWLEGRRILMLEPRRLAARSAARHMATLLGQTVGGLVGYRVRHETMVSSATRIEVLTEGVLTRLVQTDPLLEGVGLVIFDEFHERSIHADLGLALTLHSRSLVRNDLRILVTSATLDGGPVASLLGGVPVLTSPGRAYPVETRYRPRHAGGRLEGEVAGAVRQVLIDESGDLLVFLPGAGEIRRTAELLRGTVSADVVPLHGSLSAEEQDRAIRPSPSGRRKVVLATSIAETSLTIEGVRVVIDAGLSRVPRYSVRTGMARLVTVRVSRASADQRRGRAGRLGPGVCYRLWSAREDATLLPQSLPEILETDLGPLALDLAVAGIADPDQLSWLDPPPEAALAEARSLLKQLGALDAVGRVTPHGKRLSRLAMAPRLAHMVIRGREMGDRSTACELAALLSERDLLRRGDGVPDSDIRTRLDLLRGALSRSDVDRDTLRRVRREVQACRGARASPSADVGAVDPGVLLALAYPDRVAQRRPGGADRYLLRNGLGARVRPQSLGTQDYLVAAELDGKLPESEILLGAPISLGDVHKLFAADIAEESVVEWDPHAEAVRAVRRERLGALVLREGPLNDPEPERVTNALLGGIGKAGIGRIPWPPAALVLRQRIAFLRRIDERWPDLSDAALEAQLEELIGPYLGGIRRLEELRRVDWTEVLLTGLSHERRSALDRLAPTHVTVPTGSRLPVDYADPGSPVLAVRLQEMFGQSETPTLASGAVPLTLHLLSPAGRPVQVTRDLAGFWRTTYFEVKRDLKGRYPRHYWPDDPLQAAPTRRTKPRN
ncbi:MAG TPA: ATP-dependent helicase HrpB [Gemmatimonadales bacterium]|nr:ATP-dependent helicase HrpB [Gemmatimonadales bacterium]